MERSSNTQQQQCTALDVMLAYHSERLPASFLSPLTCMNSVRDAEHLIPGARKLYIQDGACAPSPAAPPLARCAPGRS